jgi:dipeptidyl-peptidase-3
LWEQIKDGLFANTDVGLMHLGYPDAGHLSTYYPDSPDITKEEITIISDFLESKKFLPENTRIRKTTNGFEVLIASEMDRPTGDQLDIPESAWDLEGKLKGKKLVLTFGDYSKEMGRIADAIENAGKHAANDNQITMMQEYSKSFRTGSLKAYKQSQRYWIRDKGPMVESDIGFVETYRDPHGIRGEWEGFAAMVNKERTKAFGKLVDAAPSLIPKLPWNKDFEKDKFLSPDFTSLEVLTFAGSGCVSFIDVISYEKSMLTIS